MRKRANRIHITSSGPRTGTNLLAEVMKVCFDIDCFCDHEAPIAVSNSSFGKCNTILTKHPSSIKGLDKVLSWDSKLYVLCIIRDPRDMVCSFHGKIKDKYYCDLQFWFDFIENHPKFVNNNRFLLIKYEDFTRNPDAIQKLILEKMPFLSKRHNFSDFHLHAKPVNDSLKALRKLRPIESKGIGNWKNHFPRIKQQVQEYSSLEDSLIAYGYEKNENWLQTIKDVEAQEFQSYKKNKSKKSIIDKSLLLTYLNIKLEKGGINPDKFLAPIKNAIR